MSNTPIYNFKKPEGTEFFNIVHQNDNWDLAEAILSDLSEEQSRIKDLRINNKPLTDDIVLTPADVKSLPDTNPTLSTRLRIDRGERFRVFKDVFHYATTLGTSNVIGILKLRLPVGYSNSMMRMDLRGYQYQHHKTWGLMFAGYNYNNAGQLAGSDWMNTTAKLDGDAPFSRVRVGYDGERCCILLGDVDTNWTYLAIYISELMVAYGMIDELSEGWGAEILTSIATISKVLEVPVQIPVPTTRKVNGKALTGDISINNNDVGLPEVINVMQMNRIAKGATQDPNVTNESLILTNHTNALGASGNVYWYILTFFYDSLTGNRAQIAIPYNHSNGRMAVRFYTGTWQPWVEVGTQAIASILSNVDNIKQMPMAGGTFTGPAVAQSNTSYTTRQLRNVIMSTGNPSGGSNGDIWLKYK